MPETISTSNSSIDALRSAVCADVRLNHGGAMLTEAVATLVRFFPHLTVAEFLGKGDDQPLAIYDQLVPRAPQHDCAPTEQAPATKKVTRTEKEPAKEPAKEPKPRGTPKTVSSKTDASPETAKATPADLMYEAIRATGGDGIAVVPLALQLGLDLRAARKLLRSLLDDNRVTQLGKTKAAKYFAA